jgi:multidrug efflux pump subunit AcrA (membrane-fusion protein)
MYVTIERPPVELRAGLLVRVGLAPPAGSAELWIPVTAVLLKGRGKRVAYIEGKDGSFAPREIEVGEERGGRVRVLKGLDAGERIVTRGALLVDREAEQLL